MSMEQCDLFSTALLEWNQELTDQGDKDDGITAITDTLGEVTMSNNTTAQAMREKMVTYPE